MDSGIEISVYTEVYCTRCHRCSYYTNYRL
jgi:hypothetical protein